jgi:catechol 2,3-dioxygenase-like lactoylglutathione lyase family enzyme
MIIGAHVLLYSTDADADRAFLRDVLGFRSVDVGHGWLIFALPPAEVAVHPVEGAASEPSSGRNVLGASFYLMCDDIHAFIKTLEGRNVAFTAIHQEPWGITTTIHMPSGGQLGLYQPLHPTALDLK